MRRVRIPCAIVAVEFGVRPKGWSATIPTEDGIH